MARRKRCRQAHAAIQREKREPRAGLEPLSLWLIAIYGLAIFFGGAYLGRLLRKFQRRRTRSVRRRATGKETGPGGGGAAQTAELTPAERGKKIFSANCATCHQMSGLGVAGQYPPLAGSEIVNGGSRLPAMIVLKGLTGPITVKGQQFGSAVMQPWEKTLNDQKIADVLTFIRQEWGNTGGPISAEQVAALRKELAGRADSWTEADLKAVPPDTNLPGGEGGAAPPNEQSKTAAPTPAPKS